MIVRVTNPDAARSPQLYAAVRRAIEVCGGAGHPLDLCTAFVFRTCSHPCSGLWVYLAGGEVRGAIAATLPDGGNPFFLLPEIYLNANWSGDPAVGRALIATVVDFVKAAGYNKLSAQDRSGARPGAQARLWRRMGVCVTPVATVYEVTEAAGEADSGCPKQR